MDFVRDLFKNYLLLVPIISWLVCQLAKVIIHLIFEHKFSIERMFGDGGMPSGHSATVFSLAVATGWAYGFDSVVFAITAVLAVVVMHDAMGVRREAGKHAESIKEIAEHINEFFKEKDVKIRTEKIKKLVGHTPLQVFVGAIVGLVVAVAVCAILHIHYKGGYYI